MRTQLLRDEVDRVAVSLAEDERKAGSRRRARSPYSPSDYHREAAYPPSPPPYSRYERDRGRRAERRDGDLYYEQRDGGRETDRAHHCQPAYDGRWEEEYEQERRGRSLFERYSRGADVRLSPPRSSRYDDENVPLYPPPGRNADEYCASGGRRSSSWWKDACGGR